MDFLLERIGPVSIDDLQDFGWSDEARSQNMIPGRDSFRVLRKPTPNSTDGIRGQKGLETGLHIWEVRWPRSQRGTYASIGVGTAQAQLHAQGYCALLGQDGHSFGWDIVARKCHHAGQEWDYPKGPRARRATRTLPERLFAILDCQKGTLAFATQNDHLGIAFRGLPTKCCPLFPMVAAVWGNAQIALRYVGSAVVDVNLNPSNLLDICRRRIRQELVAAVPERPRKRRKLMMRRLGLPEAMVDFVLAPN